MRSPAYRIDVDEEEMGARVSTIQCKMKVMMKCIQEEVEWISCKTGERSFMRK
jgi:hypothetical protein